MKIRFNRSIKLVLLVTAVLLFAFSFNFSEKRVHAYRGGPDPSRTGAPAIGVRTAELNCSSTIGCHTGNSLNDPQGTFQILDLPSSYVPGQTYTLRVSLSRPGNIRFGFQLTVLDQNGDNAGTLASNDSSTFTLDADPGNWAGRKYIEHSSPGSAQSSTNQRIWTIKWTAPATRSGRLTFFAAGNAANNDNAVTGDFIYTTSASIRPDVVTVSGASFDQTNNNASNAAIVSGFGVDLATTTATATGDADANTPGIQLPSTLGGTTVTVRDSLNMTRNATLFYVSPTQVNYLLPSTMANGTAIVAFTSSNGTISTGTLTIANVKPGIFTVNQGGTGYPAAQIQRVRNGTTIGFEDVAMGPVANPVAIPIEWKDPGDQLYLVIYGTGFRQRSQLSNVLVTVNGASQQVDYAAAHTDFAGLDQSNVLLNRNLAGSGDANVIMTVDGVAANTIKINFK